MEKIIFKGLFLIVFFKKIRVPHLRKQNKQYIIIKENIKIFFWTSKEGAAKYGLPLTGLHQSGLAA